MPPGRFFAKGQRSSSSGRRRAARWLLTGAVAASTLLPVGAASGAPARSRSAANPIQQFKVTFHKGDGWVEHWLTLRAGEAVRFEMTPSGGPVALMMSASTAASWPASLTQCTDDPCLQTAEAALQGTPDPEFAYLANSGALPAGPPQVVLRYLGGPAPVDEGQLAIYGDVSDQQYWVSGSRRNAAEQRTADWFTFIAPTTARYGIGLFSGFGTYRVRLQVHRLPPSSSFDNGSNTATPFPFRGGSWWSVCARQTPWLFSNGFFVGSGKFYDGPLTGIPGTGTGRSQMANLAAISRYYCSQIR